MPYFPYSRQSKKKTHRGAITARMLANLMNVAGVTHVITVDLHANQMQGFFKCPVDNLVAEPLLSKWIRLNVPEWKEGVVVSKNPGGTKRVTSLADALKLSFGIVTTERRRPHMMSSMYGSAVFEAMGTDGTNDSNGLPNEAEEAEPHIYKYERNGGHDPIEHDFARPSTSYRMAASGESTSEKLAQGRSRAGSGNWSLASRNRMIRSSGEGLIAPSPLSRSTQLDSESDVPQPSRDEDGYEEPEGDDDEDEVCFVTRCRYLVNLMCCTASQGCHYGSPYLRSYRRRRCSVTYRICGQFCAWYP